MVKLDLATRVVDWFYDSVMNMDSDEGQHDRSKEIHVTDLAALCIRKTFFSKKYPFLFDIPSMIRMGIGTKIHEIKLFPEDVYDDPDVYHEYAVEWNGIMGRIDEYYKGVIIDKKTTRKRQTAPSPYVMKQLKYYKVMAVHMGLDPVSAVVLYIDVAEADASAFEVDISTPVEQIERELLARKAVLEAAMNTGIPPPKEVGWWCKYCEAGTLCRKKQ